MTDESEVVKLARAWLATPDYTEGITEGHRMATELAHAVIAENQELTDKVNALRAALGETLVAYDEAANDAGPKREFDARIPELLELVNAP